MLIFTPLQDHSHMVSHNHPDVVDYAGTIYLKNSGNNLELDCPYHFTFKILHRFMQGKYNVCF